MAHRLLVKRSCVVRQRCDHHDPVQTFGQESGIYSYERYLDGSQTVDWASVAVKWVKDGIDPDL